MKLLLISITILTATLFLIGALTSEWFFFGCGLFSGFLALLIIVNKLTEQDCDYENDILAEIIKGDEDGMA